VFPTLNVVGWPSLGEDLEEVVVEEEGVLDLLLLVEFLRLPLRPLERLDGYSTSVKPSAVAVGYLLVAAEA